MDTTLLKIFITAAETENFRETAEQLMMTQPAVSKSIQKLEAQLNLPLFIRSQQRVKLHTNGHFLLPRAKKVLDAEQQMLDELKAFQLGVTEKLILGVAPQIANSMLPYIIKRFGEIYPDVSVQIELLPSNEIGEAVFRQQVDIGLTKIESTRELVTRSIAIEPIVLVVCTNLAKEEPKALLKKAIIYTHAYSPYWEQVERELPADCRIERLNQTEVIKTFVKQGLGIAFLPKSVVHTEIQTRTLTAIELPFLHNIQSATYIHMKYHQETFTRFIEVCKSIYEENK